MTNLKEYNKTGTNWEAYYLDQKESFFSNNFGV